MSARPGTAAATPAARWYRERWVWLLMIPPAASVLGGVTMVYLATSAPVTLVVEDYARIEELTRERFARDAAAAALGLEATLAFARDAQGRTNVVAELTAGRETMRPAHLTLRLSHATLREADRELVLVPAGAALAAQTELAEGRYRVELTGPDGAWRLGGSLSRVPGTLTLTAEAAPP